MDDKPHIDKDGTKRWYLNGNFHREDGPAVEHADGTKSWYLNGKRHREDGPAVETHNGVKYWYKHGKRHREDGPAIEYPDGTKSWYLNGIILTEEEFNRIQNVQKLKDTFNNPDNRISGDFAIAFE